MNPVICLDLETTGLDPAKDRILEIAAARVNERLEPVDGFSCVIRPNDGIALVMDEYVTRMHTGNGLLAALPGGVTLSDANVGLCAFLARHGEPGNAKLTLAGDSVHFDLGFLRSWLPVAAARFSHRLLDTTAFLTARAYMLLPACPLAGTHLHRATDDVMASIAKARWHMSRIAP